MFGALAGCTQTPPLVSSVPMVADLGHNVTLVRAGETAALLLDAGDAVIMVDAGSDPAAEALLSVVQSLDYSADDVATVLLTKALPGRTAGLPRFPQATVVAAATPGRDVHREVSGFEVVRHGTLDVEAYKVGDGAAIYLLQGVLALGDVSLHAPGQVCDPALSEPRETAPRAVEEKLGERQVRWLVRPRCAPLEAEGSAWQLASRVEAVPGAPAHRLE